MVVLWIVGGFVVLVVLVILAAWVVSMYNQLVSLQKRVDQANQNIDVLLKQRQDELTKLIDAAKEFLEHEEELLTELTEAREQAERASSPTEEASADQTVRTALAGFRARLEEYPDLRSQTNMLQFQERIADIENQISDRREFYNAAATRLNTRIRQFPYLLIAGPLGFGSRELWTATEEDKADVDVSAGFE